MKNQKGLSLIFLIIGFVFIAIFIYLFLAIPHRVSGSPIKLFSDGEYVFAEKVTYMFNKPEVGDRVIFFPDTRGIDYVGLITGVEQNQDIKTYKIVSGAKGTTWVVSPEKIKEKIYYPAVSPETISSILSELKQMNSSQQVSDSANPDLIGDNWKTYTNSNGFSLKYPSNMQVLGVGIGVNNTNAPIVLISTNPNKPTANTYFRLYVETISSTDKKGKSLDQLALADFQANLNATNNPAKVNSSLAQITFAGKPAYTYSITKDGYTGEGLGWLAPLASYKVVEAINGDQYYIIEISDNEIMSQILSTFKFTDKNGVVWNDVHEIVVAVNLYYAQTKKLPNNLEEIKSLPELSYFQIKNNPFTNKPYKYTPKLGGKGFTVSGTQSDGTEYLQDIPFN